ncbi:MAG: ABC transporter permease subunit [Acidobacteria bacterium]|nr:ABC transporter permease subunit [Acidobacteriota bacterium]MCL5288414.1 ABC transporter permease subunit [Acidobacteriota bacterium]
MKLRNIAVIYNKERVDMLRDRRTLFNMLLFPLIMFPLMTTGFHKLEARLTQKARQESARIMVLGAEHAPAVVEALRATGKFEIVPLAQDFKQQINDKVLRAAVEIPAGFGQPAAAADGPPPSVKIYYYQTELRSQLAVSSLEDFFGKQRDEMAAARLAGRGIAASVLTPVKTEAENVATEEKVTGARLGALVPYFIILFSLMGALHPALDLTAGEKERGTMETILASAVSRGELVMGKFFFVLTASLLTAVISLTSYGMTLRYTPPRAAVGAAGASAKAFVASFSLKSLAIVFGMVLPLAVFFSATLIAIALIARNYKEAQSYVGPIMIFAIVPAVISVLPGIELNPKLALIPILNVSLVSKEVLSGSYPWGFIALVFGATCFYAAIALGIAVLQFQREEVLFRA